MSRGNCQRAIFNFNLPVKKRRQAVMDAVERIADRLAEAEVDFDIEIRQLYHDRDEVAAYLRWV